VLDCTLKETIRQISGQISMRITQTLPAARWGDADYGTPYLFIQPINGEQIAKSDNLLSCCWVFRSILKLGLTVWEQTLSHNMMAQ
jgi:hypothetical protein